MKSEITQKSQIERFLKIEVDPKTYMPVLEKLARKVAKDFAIPGFRKGKAPSNLIVRRLGFESFKHDLIEQLIPETSHKAIMEHDIKPLSITSITPPEEIILEEGKPFSYEVIVEVVPEFELKNYKGLKLKKKPQKMDLDKVVETRINALREQSAQMEPIEEERPLEKGDVARVDFTSYIDGEKVDDGFAKDYYMTIEDKNFIPGFIDHLVGKKAGDEWEFDINFPEDYPNKKLAGNEVHFEIKLHDIMKKDLPELDDEFAKSAGSYETYEQMKEEMKKQALNEVENQEKEELKLQIIKQMSEEMEDIMVPPTMVNRNMEIYLRNLEQQVGMMGMKLEDYLKEQGTSKENFARQFYPQAREMAMAELMVNCIGKQEDIKVSDEELDVEVEKIAGRLNQPVKEIKKSMEKSGYLDNIRHALRTDKIYDFIIENGEVVIEEETEPVPEDEKAEEVKEEAQETSKEATEEKSEEEVIAE